MESLNLMLGIIADPKLLCFSGMLGSAVAFPEFLISTFIPFFGGVLS